MNPSAKPLPSNKPPARHRDAQAALDIAIGKRLKNQRCLAGVSQTQLGKFCGVVFQQIQKYEAGKDRISAGRLYQIATRLGVPITYFFDGLDGAGNDTAPAPSVANADLHRRESMNLLNTYYRIADPKKRKRVYDLIRSIAAMT
jgi:transcriptional regulator with XRE-family HTH domain